MYNIWNVGGMFNNCYKLKKINIPATCTYLGHNSFALDGDNNVAVENPCTKVDISNITYFGIRCFQFRSNITDWGAGDGVMNLNENTTYIGERCFHLCSGMTGDLNLPNLETLGMNSFGNCNLTSISNLGKITSINSNWNTSGTFANNVNLKTVVIPDVCTSIGSHAFSGCNSLTTINLDNVTSIGERAFNSCTSLNQIDISNATYIGQYAFYNCSSIEIIKLPINATTIGLNNFNNCTNVTKLYNITEFFSNVESIVQNTFIDLINIDLGDLVLNKCTKLDSAFNGSRENTYNVGKLINVKSVSAPLCTYFKAFMFSTMESLDLPECTEFHIGCGYWSTTLTTINFPKLKILGSQALERCTSLKSLTLPSTLTSIGWNTLSQTSNCKWVKIEALTPPSNDSSNFKCSWNYYVPNDSLEAYKSANVWSSYTDKIFNMSQFAIDFPNG